MDVLAKLKTLERQSEDNIWRTAKAAADEIERLRTIEKAAWAMLTKYKTTCGSLIETADALGLALMPPNAVVNGG